MRPKPLWNGPPSPEEFQRQLSDFMRQHLGAGGAPAFATPGAADPPVEPDAESGLGDDLFSLSEQSTQKKPSRS